MSADVAVTVERVRPRTRRGVIFIVALAVALVILALVSAGLGQVRIPIDEVAGSVLHRIGIGILPMPTHPRGDATLWLVRFPRIVLAILVGAALACAGALLQGVLANPLAEPGVVGVSSGAAVGACSFIIIGGTFATVWPVAGGAFLGGLLAAFLVYRLSMSDGKSAIVTIVLTGIAVNAFAGGVLAFLTYVASPTARDRIVFWQLGSLNGSTWQAVGVVFPLTVVGIAAAMLFVRKLDLLALGEVQAFQLGVDVERLRRTVIFIVAILVAAAVAFTGIVMFVGLVVPHLVRMIVGPAHAILVPASALGGAIILLVADLGARTLVTGVDLPLGMLTSLVGGPVFFWLIRRTRKENGGW